MLSTGKAHIRVNNTVYELRAGDIFLAKPSQLITYSADKEEPWEYYWVGFNGACANKLVLQLPFREDMPAHHCKNADRVKKALFNIFLSRGPGAAQRSADGRISVSFHCRADAGGNGP